LYTLAVIRNNLYTLAVIFTKFNLPPWVIIIKFNKEDRYSRVPRHKYIKIQQGRMLIRLPRLSDTRVTQLKEPKRNGDVHAAKREKMRQPYRR